MTRKWKTRPELKVLFDTSILFTQIAYDLTRPGVRQLIEENSSHPDLALSWYLPRVVVDERQYQMQQRALALLPNLEKLERLLGHKLNITPDILATRVEAAINDQIEKMSITVLDLDTNPTFSRVLDSEAFCPFGWMDSLAMLRGASDPGRCLVRVARSAVVGASFRLKPALQTHWSPATF